MKWARGVWRDMIWAVFDKALFFLRWQILDRKHLEQVLNGYKPAVDFLESVYSVLHFWDDLIDKDKEITDDVINRAMWDALITIPSSQFYRQFFDSLQPILINAIANWHAATQFERDGNSKDREVAFIIRSDYINILVQCVYIVGGREAVLSATPFIRRYWTDETFSTYEHNLDLERLARENVSSAE